MTEPTIAELEERLRRLESAQPQAAQSQANMRFGKVDAENQYVAGQNIYIQQLQERIRFLEGLDRAHKTRRFFFWLSALSLIAGLVAASYAVIKINDLVWSAQGGNATDYQTVFQDNSGIALAVVVGVIGQILAVVFLILGLLSRPPRYR